MMKFWASKKKITLVKLLKKKEKKEKEKTFYPVILQTEMKLHTLIHTLKTELPTNIMSLERHVDEVKWGGTRLPLTVPKGRLGS